VPFRLTRMSVPLTRPALTVPLEVAGEKRVRDVVVWSEKLNMKMGSGVDIQVFSISPHADLIGRARRNIQILEAPLLPARAAPLPKVSLFVAKQLLELAQLKREVCPITVEEFATDNTAVMPCGHLFTRLAIEESFKAVEGRCPACRATGAPIYV
jgi:hypothetical protein